MNSKKRREIRQIVTLAAVFAVIIILVVVYFVVSKISGGEPGETTSPLLGLGEEGTFTVADEDFTLMTLLKYTYNGETVSLHVNDDGRWALDGDEAFPVDQEKVIMMSQAISDYGGFGRYVYSESLTSDYGTDAPMLDVTATYYDDSSYTTAHERHFVMGSKATLNGNYYFYELGDTYIYTVPDLLSQYFGFGKADLFVIASVPTPEPEDIVALDVEYEGGGFSYAKDGGDSAKLEDAKAIMESLPKQTYLRFSNVVAYGLDKSGMAEYGFETPSVSVTLKYKERKSVTSSEDSSSAVMTREVEYELFFGSRFTEGEGDDAVEYVYMTDEDSGTVYKVRAYIVDDLIAASGKTSGGETDEGGNGGE